MALLALAFLVTALLYASVGFGGGSTYSALLVLNGTDYRVLPSIALVCNIIVVAGGVWRFRTAGHLPIKKIAPFLVTSIPFALIGGRIPISETAFVSLLGLSLLAAGLRMLVQQQPPAGRAHVTLPPWLAAAIGASLGFLSGLVGIGGGIFLAPILHMTRWDNARAIAGVCSLFILLNSISGLAGQLIKLGDMGRFGQFSDHWMLFPAVLIGGQIGSRLGASRLSESLLRRMTAILVLYVAVRLMLRWRGIIIG